MDNSSNSKVYVVGKVAKPSVFKTTFQWSYIKVALIAPAFLSLFCILLLILGNTIEVALVCLAAAGFFFVFLMLAFLILQCFAILPYHSDIAHNAIIITNNKLRMYFTDTQFFEVELASIVNVEATFNAQTTLEDTSEFIEHATRVNGNIAIKKSFRYNCKGIGQLMVTYLDGKTTKVEYSPYMVVNVEAVVKRIYEHINRGQ